MFFLIWRVGYRCLSFLFPQGSTSPCPFNALWESLAFSSQLEPWVKSTLMSATPHLGVSQVLNSTTTVELTIFLTPSRMYEYFCSCKREHCSNASLINLCTVVIRYSLNNHMWRHCCVLVYRICRQSNN